MKAEGGGGGNGGAAAVMAEAMVTEVEMVTAMVVERVDGGGDGVGGGGGGKGFEEGERTSFLTPFSNARSCAPIEPTSSGITSPVAGSAPDTTLTGSYFFSTFSSTMHTGDMYWCLKRISAGRFMIVP